MKHPIYRPIAIGALLALASLSARAEEHKDVSANPEAPVAGTVTKVSQSSHAPIMRAA